MKIYTKTISLLAAAAVFTLSSATAVTTGVVGYTSTTLPAGVGSIFAPSFINADSVVGVITGETSGATSSLAIANLADAAYSQTGTYPAYYLEVLNDTNGADGLDTEGLILDVVSNSVSAIVVGADAAAVGVNGDEQIAVRKHLTLGDIFANATGLVAFSTPVTIYNGLTEGSIETFLPDGAGGFVASDFVTPATDAIVYPGTGIVVNNSAEVVVTVNGTVKETPTQIAVYGGEVNFVGALKPLTSFDMTSDGALDSSFVAFADPITQYSDGTLVPTNTVLTDGAGGVLEEDFVTPGTLVLSSPSAAVVITPPGDRVYKSTGTVVSN